MLSISAQHRIGGRGLVGWIAVAAVLVSACTAGPEAGGPGSPPAVSVTPSAPGPGSVTEAELAAAGLQIVADEKAPAAVHGGRLLITRSQADRIVAEQAAGGGLLGADVDSLAPLGTGSAPMSYLVAAWVTAQPTASAKVAHRLMGERDWRHAQRVVFPLAVLAMFVTDVSRPLAAAVEPSGAPSRTTAPSRSGVRPPLDTAVDPCTDISDFLAKTLKTVFDALKLKPVNSGGLLFFVPWLVTIWNVALDLAHGIVQAVVDKLTKPVFDLLRAAIGALAVATQVVSYFTKQTVNVKLEPAGPYRFAVGSEADIRGEFVAAADKLTAKWPDALVKCAEVTKKKLPEVLNEGSTATWSLVNESVISTGPLAGKVGSDLKARLRFTTGRESDADGTPVTGRATVRVEVERKEIGDLLEEAKKQIRAVLTSLLSSLPIPVSLLNDIFDPVLNRIEAELARRVGGVFRVAGTGTVTVLFHRPEPKPTPTPGPTPTPTGRGDFCTHYRAMAKWSFDHQAPPTPEAWAAELVRRLTVMRPLAPADKLAWVSALLRVYRLVAEGAGAAAIGNEAATSNFPAAGRGLALYCKVDPALLQPR
jgi:hypothetical protein